MLLQTNSYFVAKEKRAEHARLMRRFQEALARLGCEDFEVQEEMGPQWNSQATSGRFIQVMRFHDRKHHQAVQNAERNDPAAQDLIREFCELIDFPAQKAEGQAIVGYYGSVLSPSPDEKE